MNSVGERLEYYIRHKGYILKTFAEAYDINYNTLIPVTTGAREIGMKLLHKVAAAFPELNINWLLYNRGDMELIDELPEGLYNFSLQLARCLKDDELLRAEALKYLEQK